MLNLRCDFSRLSQECEAIEFIAARDDPPFALGHVINGPTMRQSAQLLVGMGQTPHDREGRIVTDLVAACRPAADEVAASTDTLYFHGIGLALWTDTGTELGGVDTGEFLLDTVLVWGRGYFERKNVLWAERGIPFRVVVP